MTSNFNLKANLRNSLGSADSRRTRKAGNITCVIVDKKGENLNILINAREFEREYFKGNIQTTIVEIELDGKKINTIPHKIEIHPVTDKPIHVDFIAFEENTEVRVKSKIKFTGIDKSSGIKKGGFLHIALRKVEIICNPNEIPEFVEVDISQLRVGAKIRSTDLILPANIKLANKKLFNIGSILGRGAKSEEEAAEAGAVPVEGVKKEEPKKEEAKK
jgi:large subunit ribosomal protein L25